MQCRVCPPPLVKDCTIWLDLCKVKYELSLFLFPPITLVHWRLYVIPSTCLNWSPAKTLWQSGSNNNLCSNMMADKWAFIFMTTGAKGPSWRFEMVSRWLYYNVSLLHHTKLCGMDPVWAIKAKLAIIGNVLADTQKWAWILPCDSDV